MRRRIGCLFLTAGLLLGASRAVAQYYTWGSDPPLKWSTIRTPDVRMIYPDTAAALARRTLRFIDAVRPSIGYGFRHGPMRIPFVVHPENFRSNGLVMYLPKRVEFLTAPAIESYSMPWYKQLVAHEYRHAVQYNNLDRGVIRVLSYVLGQQGSTIGLLCMPIWAMEGDAVMSETMMSSFGRGLQPSFSMAYRALGNVGRDRRNIDRWFCGSYRDYIPDHYELGYQLCTYAWDRYGENVWDRVVRFGSRNPYMLATTRIALGKYYGTNVQRMFRETFDRLERHWASLPQAEESARALVDLPEDNHTEYRWPLPLGDTAVLALKTDLARTTRFVCLDRRTGRERTICHTGSVSTRPALRDGRVWWTEYRRSTLFEQRVGSQLCFLDLADGTPRTVARQRRALYPTAAPGLLGWVDYDPDGRYAVVVRTRTEAEPNETRARSKAGLGPEEFRWPMPDRTEVHGLAWDDATEAWYVLVTDDSGMWIGRVDGAGLRPVTRGAYITLSDLRAAGGRLYYGSIASGKDEAHCYDLRTDRAYRITASTYGSFAPAPAGGEALLTTYDRRGYRVAVQSLADSLLVPVAPAQLPRNLVNPPVRRWEVVNLDTVRFTAADSVWQERAFGARRYRKVPNLIRVHSWMPVAVDPFAAVDEHVIDANWGVTLLSQNLLSNTEAFASYGWNRREGSLLKLGVRYFGLGVHFDLDAAYGGNQLIYSLSSYDPRTGNPVYQSRPAPDKYYSVGLRTQLPLYFQRGYRTRQLTLSAGWNYSNGRVAELGKIEWGVNGGITNIRRIGFYEGLHRLSFGVAFTDRVRLAHRDLAPRWGYTLRAQYDTNPADRSFSSRISAYVQGYLPGCAPHHSISAAVAYQTSLGGYRFPGGYAPLSYRPSLLIPRGFASADLAADGYVAAALNYQLPVWYPEGGINSVLYFKRVRLNVGLQYAQFRQLRSTYPGTLPFGTIGSVLPYDFLTARPLRGQYLAVRRIGAAGADLILDLNLFRQPASATSTVTLSCYRPSDGGVWIGASVGLPF